MASPPQPPCPDGRLTQIEMDTASALCSTFKSPLVMTGVVLKLLQEHFSRPENLIYNGSSELGKTQLEGYIWDPDNTKTRIQIQTVWRYNTQDIQRRPALYIKRNQWTTQRLGIDDGLTVGVEIGPDGNPIHLGDEYHKRMILGSHTIFAVGSVSEGAEAELLGTEVFDYLMSFAPVLRRDLKLHRIEVMSVEPVSILEEAHEHFVVPVVLSYAFSWSWRLVGVAPWLKSLAIELFPK